MARYRTKPVIIDAARFVNSGDTADVLTEWCGGRVVRGPRIAIDTLEGTMYADPGDWIIRGVKGEFYPCKPDIFDATYEAV
jgi:hypothetical protein